MTAVWFQDAVTSTDERFSDVVTDVGDKEFSEQKWSYLVI